MRFSSVHVLALFLGASVVVAVNPLVGLDYAQYRGTALKNEITQWLGVRYAAPPIKNLRFQSPRDPTKQRGVQLATKILQHGKTCLAVGAPPTDNSMSEDCLFLDVYAPSNAKPTDKLPVYFFIQGGGFASNSNPNLNGSGLIEAADHKLVVVTHNYRVGPYGFLPGKQVEEDGSVNNGIKDQRKAMQWVQKYISKFGGDPKHVVMGGDSAGGQSVALHLTAYGGRNDGLFIGAAGESISSPTMFYNSEAQFIYDGLASRCNCTAGDSLTCLRNLSVAELQKQNYPFPFPGAKNPPLYLYGPTIDGSLIPDYTYNLFAQNRIIHVPTILGDDTNGGTIFAPQKAANYSDTDIFLHDQFPRLTSSQLQRINKLYPIKDFPTLFPKAADAGPYWRQASQAYGDMRYKCPGTYFSSQCAQNMPRATWNYRYNVLDPDDVAKGLGVPHTVEINSIWGPANLPPGYNAPASYYPGKSNAAIVPEMQAYWTSFIRALDPNKYKLKTSATWQPWSKMAQNRIVFQTNRTRMEKVSSIDQQRCKFYNSIGAGVHQ